MIRFFPAVLVAALLCLTHRAAAYIDMAPTLGSVLRDSQKIAVIEVDKFSRDKAAIIFRKIRDLKGQLGDEPIRHQVAAQGQAVPRPILEWAEPGSRAVMFISSNTALVCIGRSWYQVQASTGGWWKLGAQRPELPLAYCGTVSRLSDAVELMLAGKSAIITTVPHGADDEAASFDLALNRTSLPGLLKLQRMRADLRMPPMVMAASANPAYLVGPGPAGEEEIPTLIEKLVSSEATIRSEAADDLRSLGGKAAPAVPALTRLLDDPAPAARMSAAAALLRIEPQNRRALEVLSAGLDSPDAIVRRHAVRAAGLAGAAAAPLAGKLAGFLADGDELARLAALQAIATLGPAAAASCDAVAKLLDDPQMAIDAADALGRIGPPARSAQKHLATLLASEQSSLRWAAVRAMSQIGGEDAAPAVKFMIRELPTASDLDGYNMMIYLALLGPVAKDAIPAIQNSRVRQPALRPATIWAIEPDKRFPWQSNGRFGMPMQDSDVVRYIYESYITELGDHLKPSARLLAEKIMDGSAGNIPMWGYRLLAKFPESTLPILTPALSADDIVHRERAAVALGYMGAAAAPAKDQLMDAIRRAPTEREQRLLKWSLREIGRVAQ